MNPVSILMNRFLKKEGSKLDIYAVLEPSMVGYNCKLASTGHTFHLANNGAYEAMVNSGQKPQNVYRMIEYRKSDSESSEMSIPPYFNLDIILCSHLTNQAMCCQLANRCHTHFITIRNMAPDSNWINAHLPQWNQLLSHPSEQTVYLSDQGQESWSSSPKQENSNEFIVEEGCEDFVEKWSKIFLLSFNSVYKREGTFQTNLVNTRHGVGGAPR